MWSDAFPPRHRGQLPEAVLGQRLRRRHGARVQLVFTILSWPNLRVRARPQDILDTAGPEEFSAMREHVRC